MAQLQCICQICTCGQHRCPHNPQGNIMSTSSQPCPCSEYVQRFKPYTEARPRESLKPALRALAHDAKMEGLTTNRKDYISHPITLPPPKQVVVYVRPEGKVGGTTEYKKQFLGRWTPPAKVIRPAESRQRSQEPFDHKTSHTVDFAALPPIQREIHRENRAYTPPRDPFDGRTTAHSDYVDFGSIELTRSLKPAPKAAASTEPLDSSTSYGQSYTPHDIPARFQRAKRAYIPSTEKFSGSTSFKSDFPGHVGISPAQILRPPQGARPSDSPFEGHTVSRMSYRSWELPKRFSRPPTVYSAPTQEFSTTSTFKTDFPDYGSVPPATSLKPPPRPADNTGPFVGLTTQNIDYRTWPGVSRPAAIRREKQYEPPQDCFDGISTFRAHYQGRHTPRAITAKPPVSSNNLTATDPAGRMESLTQYRETFSRVGYKPCPALHLLGQNTATEEFTSGHTFYPAPQLQPQVTAVAV